jgi:hypothetical protein
MIKRRRFSGSAAPPISGRLVVVVVVVAEVVFVVEVAPSTKPDHPCAGVRAAGGTIDCIRFVSRLLSDGGGVTSLNDGTSSSYVGAAAAAEVDLDLGAAAAADDEDFFLLPPLLLSVLIYTHTKKQNKTVEINKNIIFGKITGTYNYKQN